MNMVYSKQLLREVQLIIVTRSYYLKPFSIAMFLVTSPIDSVPTRGLLAN